MSESKLEYVVVGGIMALACNWLFSCYKHTNRELDTLTFAAQEAINQSKRINKLRKELWDLIDTISPDDRTELYRKFDDYKEIMPKSISYETFLVIKINATKKYLETLREE